MQGLEASVLKILAKNGREAVRFTRPHKLAYWNTGYLQTPADWLAAALHFLAPQTRAQATLRFHLNCLTKKLPETQPREAHRRISPPLL